MQEITMLFPGRHDHTSGDPEGKVLRCAYTSESLREVVGKRHGNNGYWDPLSCVDVTQREVPEIRREREQKSIVRNLHVIK